MMDVQWNNEASLALIEEYQRHQVLWNPLDPWYTSKMKRHEAWEAIAKRFQIDVQNAKLKINSLLASFRREVRREKTKATESGLKVKFTSTWFAFQALSFLLPSKKMGAITAALKEPASDSSVTPKMEAEGELSFEYGFVDATNAESEDEFVDEVNDMEYSHELPVTAEDNSLSCAFKESSQPSSSVVVAMPVPKSKKFAKRPRLEQHDEESTEQVHQSVVVATSTSTSTQPLNSHSEPDECAVYSQYVANKMRKYNNRTRSFVEHAINNILFDADMGKYDK